MAFSLTRVEDICPTSTSNSKSLTLKQTNNEKGRVIITIPHEIIVRSHPQRPMPDSVSSAEKGREEREPS